jgi:LysR family transcriptional regulator, glycine cleavage system transcriptional activator
MRMPPRRPPSLLALRAFEAAARRLSFTDAARELHVSQAAISRHVRGLEKDVGRELFRRLHRAVELTVPGRQFAAELAAGFLRIHRAVDAVRGVTTRRLRLTVEPGFASRWLVPRLGSFSAAHPEMELEIETSDELRVIGRDADVAIRYLSIGARRPRTKHRRLFSIESIPMIAGVRPRPAKLRHDAAVLGYRLLHDDDGRAWRSWFAAAGQDGFDRAKHLYFTDYSLAIAAALQGQGVVLADTAFVAPELKNGRLVRIGNSRAALGEYVLLEANDRSGAAGRAAFIRWLDGEILRTTPTSAAADV